jgi:hypothetical protein
MKIKMKKLASDSQDRVSPRELTYDLSNTALNILGLPE